MRRVRPRRSEERCFDEGLSSSDEVLGVVEENPKDCTNFSVSGCL